MSKRILVTGGSGFIGSNFIRFVPEQRPDWRIVNLDCLAYSGNPENLADLQDNARYRFVRGNINDRKLVDQLLTGDEAAEAIVHFAAESHVDRSLMDARPFLEANVLGTQTLLDAVRAAAGQRRRRPCGGTTCVADR